MNKFSNILGQYCQQDLTDKHLDNLLDNSLIAIAELSNKKNQLKYRWLSFGWYVSSASAGLSFLWLLVDLNNSGSLTMIKMLINRFSLVADNWQDYLLSVSDLLPFYSLVTAMMCVAIFVVLNKEKRRLPAHAGNQLNHFIM